MTVRKIRLRECAFSSEKEPNGKSHGIFEEMTIVGDNIKLRAVTLLTAFGLSDNLEQVERYDRKHKSIVQVEFPYVRYSSIGGVDLGLEVHRR